ncbi:MAG: methyltransferase domain-containing protein [Pseudomonadota bacterium]
MAKRTRYLDSAYQLTHEDTPDRVRAIYDAWAEHYDEELVDENAYVMPARAADALAGLIPECARAETHLLDAGCGTGLSGAALKTRGFTQMDGCDLSLAMLAKARERDIYKTLFEANLAEPMRGIDDATYDAVTVVGAFSFGHIPVNAIDELLRVTRPQGVILLTTNDHYYDTGVLQPKLDALQQSDAVRDLTAEHGAHIEGLGVGGWVFTMRRV